MTDNKEGPFRHIPGGESLPACWPECPACAYAAGVKAEHIEYPSFVHDFYIMASVAPPVVAAIEETAAQLKAALG